MHEDRSVVQEDQTQKSILDSLDIKISNDKEHEPSFRRVITLAPRLNNNINSLRASLQKLSAADPMMIKDLERKFTITRINKHLPQAELTTGKLTDAQ